MVDTARRGATKQTILLVFLALLVGVAMGQLGGSVELTLEPATDGPPTPAFGGRIESAPRAEILTYARGLSFAAAEGPGDTQHLTVVDLVSVPPALASGPLVRIEPMQGAARLERPSWLRVGSSDGSSIAIPLPTHT